MLKIHLFFFFRYDALCILLRHSKNVRFWFAHNVLFSVSNRFSEYLLECPSAEVRGAFAKLIVFLAHFSLQDGPCPSSFTSPGPSSQVIESFALIMKCLKANYSFFQMKVINMHCLRYVLYMKVHTYYWIH